MRLFFLALFFFFSSDTIALAVESVEAAISMPSVTIHVDVSEYQTTKHSTLGDVSSCQGVAALCESLLAQSLASLAMDGVEQVSVTQDMLGDWLRKDHVEVDITIEPFGNLNLLYHKRELSEDDLYGYLQKMCDDFNRQNTDVNLEPSQVQMLQRSKLTSGVVNVQFPELEQRFSSEFGIDLKPFRTPVHLTALITLDDDRATQVRWSLMARFAARMKMAVFKRSVSAGDVIVAEDLQDAWKSLEDVGFQSVAPSEDVIGKSSRLTQHSGDIPRSAQLYKPILVKFGEDVDVAVGTQGMRVVTKGRAIGQGGMGDRIAIMISGGKKKVFAKIVSTGKAEVLSE